MRDRTTCCVGIDGVHDRCCLIDARRTVQQSFSKGQSRQWNRFNTPFADVSTGDDWMQIGHGDTARQGQILWVVIQTNNRFKDGQIDCVERCTTRCVGPDCEGCTRQVNRRRSTDDTVVEIQSGW